VCVKGKERERERGREEVGKEKKERKVSFQGSSSNMTLC